MRIKDKHEAQPELKNGELQQRKVCLQRRTAGKLGTKTATNCLSSVLLGWFIAKYISLETINGWNKIEYCFSCIIIQQFVLKELLLCCW